MSNSSSQPLAQNLQRLLREGGDNNFLIVSCGEAYVQFTASPGASEIYCETVSNEYLPRARQLSNENIAQLKQLTFAPPDGDIVNFSAYFAVRDDAALHRLADLALHVLTTIYGCNDLPSMKYELNLE